MTMQPFTVVTGPAAPLLRANIDTDVIIRIEHLTMLSRKDLGRYAMEVLRYLPDGREDPSFILNQPAFRGAPILLAGPNFGCGSSREHAVWALQGAGLRCVIAPSFGDIFYANCFQNGVLPIRLPMDVVQDLAAQCAQGEPLSVDLQACGITAPNGRVTPFPVDARRREMMLHGLDEIGLTLTDAARIRAWQAADRLSRPWAWPGAATVPTA
ncbi:3-isopropylmalate/(R)-2-methylmalate dehydratase small subunit [Cupriavidus alkaliphilus]|nr:3-isopropylmalate/(R)-2-methylmalate dehydratase small subunit [Cupriavidus alkaliphilus]